MLAGLRANNRLTHREIPLDSHEIYLYARIKTLLRRV